MNSARNFRIVMVTAPDLKSARKLIRIAVKARHAACGNLIPKIESHYWWQGKLEKSAEVLILFKTTSAHLKPLEELILKHHPYDTPEIIALPMSNGNTRFLDWISTETRQKMPAIKRR